MGLKDRMKEIKEPAQAAQKANKTETAKTGLKERMKAIPSAHPAPPRASAAHKKEKQIVESYEIEKGKSRINIWYDEKSHEYLYEVIEPLLNEREKMLLNFIKETMIATLNVDVDRIRDKDKYLLESFEKIMRDYEIRLDDSSGIFYYVRRDFLGYGKIDAVIGDALLEDVSCDGPGIPLYVYHKNYENIRTNVVFDEFDLDSFVIQVAQKCGKHISISEPMLDASFPDGSRLQATYSKEVTAGGSSFTIRKFRKQPFTPLDLIKYGTIDSKIAAFYWLVVENGKNMALGGGTASGKTTALNAISMFIPPNAKVISIEDTRELELSHENWIKSVTRAGFGGEVIGGRRVGEINMYELLKAALRQRPEYILVGEVRGVEASVAFQAMATGHVVYTTLHAESTAAVIHRLESEPINIPRIIMQALDIVSIQALMSIGGKKQRKIKEITEIIGIEPETKEVRINNVFRYNEESGRHAYSGRSYTFEKIANSKGLSVKDVEKEWHNREKLIDGMMKKGISNYIEFVDIIVRYYKDRDSVIKEMCEGGQ